jgi:hypothetical protein
MWDHLLHSGQRVAPPTLLPAQDAGHWLMVSMPLGFISPTNWESAGDLVGFNFGTWFQRLCNHSPADARVEKKEDVHGIFHSVSSFSLFFRVSRHQ